MGSTDLTVTIMDLSPYLSNLHYLESLLPSSSLSISSSKSLPTTGARSWTSEARSAASCPPQTGFNAFAFLAFILIAIDTIMNINNNINNNNNNNNNNDRNNNNNFEAMNMNMKRSFKEDNLCSEVAAAESLLNNGSSPWSPEVWTAVAGKRRGLGVMRGCGQSSPSLYSRSTLSRSGRPAPPEHQQILSSTSLLPALHRVTCVREVKCNKQLLH